MNRRTFAALLLGGALAAQGAQIPRPAPEFPFTLADGKGTNINAYKGKVIVVEFLLVTCPHCQSTARVMNRLQAEYGKKGVQMLGISIAPGADLKNFAQLTGAAFPLGVARSQESVYSYLQHSIMQSQFYVPQIVVIDKAGMIREQHGGTDPWLQNEEANLRGVLDKLTAEGASKSAAPARKKPVKRAS